MYDVMGDVKLRYNVHFYFDYAQGEVTSRALWSRYNRHFVGKTRHIYSLCVELNGEDLSCYSNKIESVCFKKCLHDH